MVSFFRKKKSTAPAAATAKETTKKQTVAPPQEEQSPPAAADSVESGNTATTTTSSSTNNSSSNKKNSPSSPSPTIALRKNTLWLGRSKTTTTTASSASAAAAASPPSSPSSGNKPPPPRPPPNKAETAAATSTAATKQASSLPNSSNNSNNNNRARRRKKVPGSSSGGGVGGGSSAGGAAVSLWSSRSSSRSNVLPTVQEEVESGTTTTPSTAAGGGEVDVTGGTPETLDTTVTSTNDDDDDDDDVDDGDGDHWLTSIALEPVVDASFDESDGQVEILTLATKQQRDVILRDEGIKKQLFQRQQQLEHQVQQQQQLQELQQLVQQQQQQQPQEHAVKSVPMMMMMPYSSSPSHLEADCISKRSVSPLTISTGEKLLAASSSSSSSFAGAAAAAAATSANNKLVVAEEKNATLLNNALGGNSSNNNNNAHKRSSSTPNVGEKENTDINNNSRARSSASDVYQVCDPTTTITAASDAIIQPFATHCGGAGVVGACTSQSASWTENITVTVESTSCTFVEQQNGKATTAEDGDGGRVQHDNVGADAQQDDLDETFEDQSTIPTYDSAYQHHSNHDTIIKSSSSLASHSYAMRASSGIGMAAAAAAAMGSSAGHHHYDSGSRAVIQDHHHQQQQVSSHKERFQAAADKFSSAFKCSYAPQEILERPLGVMSMFYDQLCLSPHDRQKLYGKGGQDGKDLADHQENDWATTRKNKPFFSEEFAVMFINRMVSEGISLLYLQSPGTPGNEDNLEWKGKSVTMMIAPGSTGEAEMIQPKLEWTTMPGGISQDMVTSSLPLLNIHSIITHAHNNDTLGDEMELDDDMCFFSITSRQGAVYVFEANTPDQRDAIVDGLQNAIARLAFHLVTGDPGASTELYNDDRNMLNQQQQQEDAGELPALPNPKLNMNRIAHMMLDC